MAKQYRVVKKVVKKRKSPSSQAAGNYYRQWASLADNHLHRFYIGFFLLSLLFRVIYVLSLQSSPLFDALVMDPAYHEKVALSIYNGDWLGGDGPFHRSPLYMYVLALLYKLFGHGYLVPRLFGAVTGSISVILIMRVAQRLFGALPAVIAGLIAMLSWVMIYFDGELLTTSFTIMMGLILLLLFIRAWETPTIKNTIILGLFFGLTAITRENYLPIIGLVFLFLIVARRQLIQPALFFVAALLMILPISIRNYVVLDDFVLLNPYTPVNFYIGNNPYSDGRTAILPYTRADWYGGIEDVTKVVEKHIGHPPKPSEISAFWMAATLEYIFKNFFSCDLETMVQTPTIYDEPLPPPVDGKCRAFLPVALKKLAFVFDLREYSNNKEMYFFRDQSAVLRLPIFSPFNGFLYIPLGLLGIFLAIRTRNRKAIPLYVIMVGYLIGLSLGFVNSRIRMPVMVMLIIFSGYAIACLWEQRQQLWPRLAGVAAIMLLALVLNIPKPGSRDRSVLAGHFTLGNAYLRKGDLDQAQAHYDRSVRLTVGEYQMRSLAGLAEIELQRGIQHVQTENLTLAIESFRRSLQYRESFEAWLNLAGIIGNSGSEDPLPYYERALELSPNNPNVYVSLAQYYKNTGDMAAARENLQQAKQYDDGNNFQLKLYINRLESEFAQP